MGFSDEFWLRGFELELLPSETNPVCGITVGARTDPEFVARWLPKDEKPGDNPDFEGGSLKCLEKPLLA